MRRLWSAAPRWKRVMILLTIPMTLLVVADGILVYVYDDDALAIVTPLVILAYAVTQLAFQFRDWNHPDRARR